VSQWGGTVSHWEVVVSVGRCDVAVSRGSLVRCGRRSGACGVAEGAGLWSLSYGEITLLAATQVVGMYAVLRWGGWCHGGGRGWTWCRGGGVRRRGGRGVAGGTVAVVSACVAVGGVESQTRRGGGIALGGGWPSVCIVVSSPFVGGLSAYVVHGILMGFAALFSRSGEGWSILRPFRSGCVDWGRAVVGHWRAFLLFWVGWVVGGL
jgi:hypothetical protein